MSSLEDDRVVAYSGAALLDGAAAGLLWMQRSHDAVLCFDTTRHTLIVTDEPKVGGPDMQLEIAPLLMCPYQTTSYAIHHDPDRRDPISFTEVDEDSPWRRHHVIGVRIRADKHVTILQDVLQSLKLLPTTGGIHRGGVHHSDDDNILDLPTLFAVCELGVQLRDLDHRKDAPTSFNRLRSERVKEAQNNPLLTDFLPDNIRRRFLSSLPPLTASDLRLNEAYWETRLQQQSGEHATSAGRQFVRILDADKAGPGR